EMSEQIDAAEDAAPEIDRALTPFGERVRELRRERGLQLKHMANSLGVSSAYLSALERGERGRPTWTLIQGVIHYFGIIWDEADELQRLADMSETKPQIDARGTGARARLVANRLARDYVQLDEGEIEEIAAVLDRARTRRRART
ncbi:MAG TPA: helix-turn-helix domain-containing protein, partial [Saliniramus sp.]|nr:helix-turn-helix domain-containing protein [Saliniramus sp.]